MGDIKERKITAALSHRGVCACVTGVAGGKCFLLSLQI